MDDMWAIKYTTYNEFQQTALISRKREAVMISESLKKLKHVSNVEAYKIPAKLKRQMDSDISALQVDP